MVDPTGGVFKIATHVRIGKWAQDPCYRCHRQPKEGEMVQLDWMTQTVLCGHCHAADTTALGNLLAEATGRLSARIDGSPGGEDGLSQGSPPPRPGQYADGCSCACHAVVQPGLVPCPSCWPYCDLSSRYDAPRKET